MYKQMTHAVNASQGRRIRFDTFYLNLEQMPAEKKSYTIKYQLVGCDTVRSGINYLMLHTNYYQTAGCHVSKTAFLMATSLRTSQNNGQ